MKRAIIVGAMALTLGGAVLAAGSWREQANSSGYAQNAVYRQASNMAPPTVLLNLVKDRDHDRGNRRRRGYTYPHGTYRYYSPYQTYPYYNNGYGYRGYDPYYNNGYSYRGYDPYYGYYGRGDRDDYKHWQHEQRERREHERHERREHHR